MSSIQNHGEVTSRITKFITEQGKNVEPTDQLFETGIMDSLSLLEMVVFIEREFCVEVDQDMMNIENFETIEKIALLVLSLAD